MTEEMIRTPAMIAGEINAIKEQVRNTALVASVEIGRKLKEAKGLVAEGEWTQWLERHVDYSARTAQNLMALAEEFDAGRGEALKSLNYTKAVLLLSVPQEEREAFAAGHDLAEMSTREMQKEIAALKKRNGEMQLTMDGLIAQAADSPVEDLKKQVAQLEEKLAKTSGALETAAQAGRDSQEAERELRRALAESQRQLNEAREEAQRERGEMAKALEEARRPALPSATPPDVEEELRQLRSMAARSQEENALRAGYELIANSMERLERQLLAMEQRDEALGARFRRAFARGMRLMADGLESRAKEEKSA